MSTLYELTDEYRQLLTLAEDPDTDPEFLKDTFEALSGEIEAKADGYAKADKELEAKAAIIKAEAERLKNWLSAIERNRKILKMALQESMIATGKRKFETDFFRFSITKNPPSVVMDEYYIGNIPEEYLKYKDPEIDRKKILADLKAGKDLDGIAHLEQGESLRIR